MSAKRLLTVEVLSIYWEELQELLELQGYENLIHHSPYEVAEKTPYGTASHVLAELTCRAMEEMSRLN